MAGCKYKHTFYLISGEKIVSYSPSKEISHVSFDKEVMFVVKSGDCDCMVPFFSVGYIETEEIGE